MIHASLNCIPPPIYVDHLPGNRFKLHVVQITNKEMKERAVQ